MTAIRSVTVQFFGKMQNFLMLKQMVDIVITGLLEVNVSQNFLFAFRNFHLGGMPLVISNLLINRLLLDDSPFVICSGPSQPLVSRFTSTYFPD